MSKYQPLGDFLKAQDTEQVSMTFAQIERVLGANLPASAYDYSAWWANDEGKSHVQARAWLEAGFATEQVNPTTKRVVFRKVRSKRKGVMENPLRYGAAPDKSKLERHPAFGALKGTFTITPADLAKPALGPEEFAEMEANLERTANLIEHGLSGKPG